jgi:hypothetical protein
MKSGQRRINTRMRWREILLENLLEAKNTIFADTASYDPTGPVPKKIHQFLEKLLKPLNFSKDSAGHFVTPVGSAFRPRRDAQGQVVSSNDWDSQIEIQDVLEAFPADLSYLTDKQRAKLESKPEELEKEKVKASKKQFADWFTQQGIEAKVIGITVHVRVPVADKFYQADLELVKNRPHVSQYHRHDIPQGSEYKGVHKHVFLRVLAKEQGKLWSPWEGLYNRDEQGVKTTLISTEPTAIAKSLFGPNASATTLDNVENMMAALPADQAQRILELAKQDRSWI